jgi:hypothetical protein
MSPRPGGPRPPGFTHAKILTTLLASLALAGAVAAAAAAAFAIVPVTASRIDAGKLPASPVKQVRSVGLDHGGGDLKRAPRLTRRSRRRSAGQLQSWADTGLIVLDRPARQVACRVLPA